MKLVLAEKPSVAQSIAKVLGAAKREDGYLEGNGYAVSYTHLRSTFWTPKTLPVLRSARPRNGRFRKNRQIP